MKPTFRHKRITTHIAAALLSLLSASAATTSWGETNGNQNTPNIDTKETVQRLQPPRIQLAILLDTSNSMDGLIDQTRNQLWRIVDEFSKARRHDMPATLEVAVYEYGNDSLDRKNGFVRKVTGLTTDLDRVSEALFSLTTNGGSEYCGYTIMSATEELQWSRSDKDIKAIFIAGNEPFTQGPIAYKRAISSAMSAGIKVNTIHAGSYQEGLQTGWQDGAKLAGGDYMSIDHNHKIAHVSAPQDQRIAQLNQELNSTYIPYGDQGKAGKTRQMEQDKNSSSISTALLSKRVKSKAGSLYNNTQWDLVDAVEKEALELESLDNAALPAEMHEMEPQQRKAYVEAKAKQRADLKKEISELSKQREKYVAQEKRKSAAEEVSTVNDALVSSVRKQGKAKNYKFLSE
jgi:hypothetical protein